MTTKRLISGFSIAALMILVAKPALAHSGHHGESGLLSALQHIAQSPFHMMLAGVAGGFALLLLQVVHKRRHKSAVHLMKDE